VNGIRQGLVPLLTVTAALFFAVRKGHCPLSIFLGISSSGQLPAIGTVSLNLKVGRGDLFQNESSLWDRTTYAWKVSRSLEFMIQ